jgi:hypothetical protein
MRGPERDGADEDCRRNSESQQPQQFEGAPAEDELLDHRADRGNQEDDPGIGSQRLLAEPPGEIPGR